MRNTLWFRAVWGAAVLVPALLAVGGAPVRAEAVPVAMKVGDRPAIDLAILLDTSNSMDGLIRQAKSQIWTIVQQFAKAEKDGRAPAFRVALFEYGNTNLPASEGYLRQVVPLTDDLDKLSEALFALTTRGGSEYCGQVIREALDQLDWSPVENGYKAIFIAGNEPFTQGSVNFRDSCSSAIDSGVVVNTIHCGPAETGVRGKWREAAEMAEGEAFNIDQDRAVVQIHCPQDVTISKLNVELNATYLWYGAAPDRAAFGRNQAEQDANASKLGPSTGAGRAMAKSGRAYRNFGRCLVETYLEDNTVLEKVKPEELPDALRDLTQAERVERIRELAARRQELKEEIVRLVAERKAHLVKERMRLSREAGGDETLGDAVVSAVRSQLAGAGFEVD